MPGGCAGLCFFFKQKKAYEMRISDWSADVCSSDLPRPEQPDREPREAEQQDRDADRFVQLVSREKFGAIVPLERPAERDLESEPQRDEPVQREDRKSVVKGKSVSVRVGLGGRRIIKKKFRTKIIVTNTKSTKDQLEPK